MVCTTENKITPLCPNLWPIIFYVGLPNFLFILGFYKIFIAVPLAVLLVLALYVLKKDAYFAKFSPHWVAPLCLSVFLLLIIGFGPNDWRKHWAILNTLIDCTWPAEITLEGQAWYLRYYVGFYLVPALMCKFFPFLPLLIATHVWLGIGYFFIFHYISFYLKDQRKVWAACCLLLMMGGAGFWVSQLLDQNNVPLLGTHSDIWFGRSFHIPVEYAHLSVGLFWWPNQAIPSFLCAIAIFHCSNRQQFLSTSIIYTFIFLWSPLGAIGLLPLMIVSFWPHRKEIFEKKTLMIIGSLALYAILLVIYFSHESSNVGLIPTVKLLKEISFSSVGLLIFLTLFFLFIELAPYYLLQRHFFFELPSVVAFSTLLIIPFIGLEDFSFQVSKGPLYFLAIRALFLLFHKDASKDWLSIIVAILLMAPGAISEFVYERCDLCKMEIGSRNFPLTSETCYTIPQILNDPAFSLSNYFSRTPAPLFRISERENSK